MNGLGENPVNIRVRQRPASSPVPETLAVQPVANPAPRKHPLGEVVADAPGIDVTDGVHWKALGQVRLLGRVEQMAGKAIAWMAVEGGFVRLGEFGSFNDASARISAKKGLYDPDKHPGKRTKMKPVAPG